MVYVTGKMFPIKQQEEQMKYLLPIIFLIMASCAAPNTMMVNPNNDTLANCSATGFGVLGTIATLVAHDNCVESMRSVGYITVEEYKNR